MDLVPDLLILRVPAPQLALIEKGLNARRAQCLADPLGWLRILKGIAQKDRVALIGHSAPVTARGFSGSARSAMRRLFVKRADRLP